MKERKVLFVCTGNVFRSLSAEYALKKYLIDSKIKGWQVSSAGIIAKKQFIHPKTISTFNKFGVDVLIHVQRKLSRKILDESDLIIAMSKNHVDFIKSNFNFNKVFLFNELAINRKSSVKDIDSVKNYMTNKVGVDRKIRRTIMRIMKSTPNLFKQINKILN